MPQQSLEKLLKTVKHNDPQADIDLVSLAFDFAANAHKGQTRASGEPYIFHSLATAQTLAELNLDVPIIIAGLLHDVPEDTAVTLADIEKNFGADVAGMVSGITKLGKLKYRGVERYIENLRKMFVAMAQDIRVVLIKFADRLHNLKTLDHLPEKKRYRVALESLEIFAPLAGRLGMGEIRAQLEDLSFKYVNPKEYEWIIKLQTESSHQRKKILEEVKNITQKEMETTGVNIISFQGRVKHVYSLYRKILRYNRDISKIYDIIALRLIVKNVADCYAALGIVHKLWRPMPGRIKDYIAQPKPNGYQSLHTTIFALENQIVEFQIRTQKMHEESEFGIAAHWNFKDGGEKNKAKLTWIKELSAFQQNALKKMSDLEAIKFDFLQNRIFIFTPNGDIIDLPESSTPVDFAYAIHTDVGNQCTGAKVNNQLSSLDSSLRNGDVVEIITDKKRKGPNPAWLDFVKTHVAKQRIRSFARDSLASWVMGKIPFWSKHRGADDDKSPATNKK